MKAVKQKISGDIAKYHMGINQMEQNAHKRLYVHYTSKIGSAF